LIRFPGRLGCEDEENSPRLSKAAFRLGEDMREAEAPGKTPLSRTALEELYERHHRPENLHPDPLVFARGYEDPLEGEVAGLVAAAFAYGRVEAIMGVLERIFRVLRPLPRTALGRMRLPELADAFRDFYYRFQKEQDLVLFLHLLARTLDRHGSLAALFRRTDRGTDIKEGLVAFSEELLAADPRPLLSGRHVPERHPVRYLVTSPAKGGASKRLCLFLRWMCRKDCLDPGYWEGLVPPSRLVVPLDTHVAQVSRELGLTGRSAADWRTALEVTAALRRYDPNDPVRYDFSLFRFGLEKSASSRRRRPA
jgi:uncharacterized protein (TIGR02757 family)